MIAQTYLHSSPRLKEFVCGGTAATVNICATFPPNKIMFRQQLYGMTTFNAFQSIYYEGLKKLYRGVTPPLLQATASKSCMFGLYKWFGDFFHDLFGNKQHVNTLAALCSGTSEAILCPFERAQTLLQTPTYDKFSSTSETFNMIHSLGMKEHFRGCTAILMRNGPSNMIFFGLREPLQEYFHHRLGGSGTVTVDFFTGGCLGAAVSTIFYPVNVVKTRMQSKLGGRFLGFSETLDLLYVERGKRFRHLYRGVGINFSRSLVSWGIINSVYERLKAHI